MKIENCDYYLGLDIGTDSVGYAVTNRDYDLMKFRGEAMWGVTTFDAAVPAKSKRLVRTARRRLDRRQQRVQLLSEIFAPGISAIDPNFFLRRKESALFPEDTQFGVSLFEGGITDREYHKKYPTIHHLILDLMTTEEARDIRLVYLACAWLLANRGHFLIDADITNISNFSRPYSDLSDYLTQECEASLPWPDSVSPDVIQEIMQARAGVKKKKEMFKERVYGGKAPAKKPDAQFPYSRDSMVALLSGGKVAPKDLFVNDGYAEVDSFSLDMDEEGFMRIAEELGEDGDLLRILRSLYDCALLNTTLSGYNCISEEKVAVYQKHAEDLKWLKAFIRKYKPEDYAPIFRRAEEGNYAAYTHHSKRNQKGKTPKNAPKDVFSDYLKKKVRNIPVEDADREKYEDMLDRLEQGTFLPKQKDTNNRIIPQQLYRYELSEILSRGANYLPMLNEADKDGITNREKVLSIFDFKIPYYVGPLNQQSENAWLVRRIPGKIYPWNFEDMVDLDESERRFIQRMTNTCTYLPGEDVLPYCSLLYSRFTVLNELNNLKINGQSIPVVVKQELYHKLFEESPKKVTKAGIERYLKACGYWNPTDELSGVDVTINANLKSYHSFRRMLTDGVLTEEQAEDIINHAAYSESRSRMEKWLERSYPHLSAEDRKYILRLNLKKFGRLSRHFLTGIMGCAVNGTGEATSILDALWQTNENLMQLLSERYTFREQIEAFAADYYADPEHKKTLSQRLTDMYISNAVKRPIIRTLDIVSDVVKARGTPPKKIFVEMVRGGTQEQKGKRTVTRKQQLLELYKKVKDEEIPRLKQELESMGDMANNRLQSDKLFLYYLQLGKCMYTENPITLSQLFLKDAEGRDIYNIDHIYPQSKVKDDSILNNKVLVLSTVNGDKRDEYPIASSIRDKMRGFWTLLKDNGLITEEKFRRLTRPTGFSDSELHQFINRQLVETRQSTKAVAQLLKERFPDTEVVYVKAGMVSEFRQQFDMLKCRSVNDLHHAKDAYLNIVVGNVYHEMFTSRWFDTSREYTISVKKIFEKPQTPYGNAVWNGKEDVKKVRQIMAKNNVHVTRYAFCRKGGLFDQRPVAATSGLVPRKKNLPPEKYGGYNKTTASYFLLASFTAAGKRDVMLVPVELQYAQRMEEDAQFCLSRLTDTISELNGGKQIEQVHVLLNGRRIKIQSVFSFDGMRLLLGGKSGSQLQVRPLTPLLLGTEWEQYAKRLDAYRKKVKAKSGISLDADHDGISAEKNTKLYEILTEKCQKTVFRHCPGNIAGILEKGKDAFAALSTEEQTGCLNTVLSWFNDVGRGCDLRSIGGGKTSGSKQPSMKLSSWAKQYSDVRIIDSSASGLFEASSENLLDLL